jgi:hypothetical protein
MESLNRKASKDAAMQQIRTVEEILRRWDPIGVEPGIFAPPDEYDPYAPHIVSMVQNGCTIGELAAHLDHLSADTMGVGPSSAASRAHSLEFSTQIISKLRNAS